MYVWSYSRCVSIEFFVFSKNPKKVLVTRIVQARLRFGHYYFGFRV